MRIPLLAAALLLCSSVGLADTSPRRSASPFSWSRFPVGSWTEFRIRFDDRFEVDMRVEVKERSRKNVVVEWTTEAGGEKRTNVETQPMEKDLRGEEYKTYQVTARGRETLVIGDRRIPCSWEEYKIVEKDHTGTARVWGSRKVPSGLVKMEVKVPEKTDKQYSIELIDFGRQAKKKSHRGSLCGSVSSGSATSFPPRRNRPS